MSPHVVVVVIGLLVSCLAAGDAHAFLCTRAGSDGPSLAWEPRTIAMHRSGAGVDVTEDEFDRVIEAAMVPWNAVACSDIALVLAEPAERGVAGFDWAEGTQGANENIIVFRNDSPDDPIDAWLHQREALAITTVTFESNQGRLLDADIEINDVFFDFSTCDPEDEDCDVTHDLQNTMTHELGHVLGLDHSEQGDATMFANAAEGDTSKRTLSGDDEEAICLVYPSGGPVGECFQVEREAPPDVRFAPTVCGSTPDNGVSLGAVAILGVALRSRTRRHRR